MFGIDMTVQWSTVNPLDLRCILVLINAGLRYEDSSQGNSADEFGRATAIVVSSLNQLAEVFFSAWAKCGHNGSLPPFPWAGILKPSFHYLLF